VAAAGDNHGPFQSERPTNFKIVIEGRTRVRIIIPFRDERIAIQRSVDVKMSIASPGRRF
jgi:hypothetical protein